MRSPTPISPSQIENHAHPNLVISPTITPKRATGGFALLDSLYRHGVEYIFGYPGGAILPIYDDLYKVPTWTRSR